MTDNYIPFGTEKAFNRKLIYNNHTFILIKYAGHWCIQHNSELNGITFHRSVAINPIPRWINQIKSWFIIHTIPKYKICACGCGKAEWVIKNPNTLSLGEKGYWVCCNSCVRFYDMFLSKRRIRKWLVQRSVIDDEGKTRKIRT